jgi:hypothetical protein
MAVFETNQIKLVSPLTSKTLRSAPMTSHAKLDPRRVALEQTRLAVLDWDSLFVWDWSTPSARPHTVKLTGVRACGPCKLEFHDAQTLQYGAVLVDIASGKLTPLPSAQTRTIKLADGCEVVQARASWQIIAVTGWCGELEQDAAHEPWAGDEHVVVRASDYHSPAAWPTQLIDATTQRPLLALTSETQHRPLLARMKDQWFLIARSGWLPMQRDARWIKPTGFRSEPIGRFATEEGVFIRGLSGDAEEDQKSGTSVSFWDPAGTRRWETKVVITGGDLPETLASGHRILVGGDYAIRMRKSGERTTDLQTCESGRCASLAGSTSVIDYDHPWVLEDGKARRVRNLDTGATVDLALGKDCEGAVMLPGAKSFVCVGATKLQQRSGQGAAEGPEIALQGYPSDIRKVGRFLSIFGSDQYGTDPEEVRRVDPKSGDIVRVFFDGEAAVATYADDSVEFFGDRSSIDAYVHCARDGKIFLGRTRDACSLRESPGRFAKTGK